MFDPDVNMPRINRGKTYLTSEIGGRSMNSRRLNGIYFYLPIGFPGKFDYKVSYEPFQKPD
jgi:hypothetical protein